MGQKKKKGADSGVDGELFFRDSPNRPPSRAVISVKGGNLQPSYVRELVGVVKRDGAAIGVLLTLHKPSQSVIVEATKAGFYESPVGRHPKIQIVTAEDVLDGRGVDVPGMHIAGVKKARRAPPRHEQMRIPGLASTHPPAPASSRAKKNS